MNNPIFRYVIIFLFLLVAGLAINHNRDYAEASIWICFALALFVQSLTGKDPESTKWQRYVAGAFIVSGIIILILRLTGILPVPVRPLP